MPALIESKLAQAARHVAEGRNVVVRQRALIAKQKQSGQDTFYSENLLAQFERTLAIFEDHFREIENEVDEKREAVTVIGRAITESGRAGRYPATADAAAVGVKLTEH